MSFSIVRPSWRQRNVAFRREKLQPEFEIAYRTIEKIENEFSLVQARKLMFGIAKFLFEYSGSHSSDRFAFYSLPKSGFKSG